jgi:hypothetical protein
MTSQPGDVRTISPRHAPLLRLADAKLSVVG